MHGPREEIEPSFDWFKSYADISHIIKEVIPDKSSKILMLGCGNSKLSEEVRYGPSEHAASNVTRTFVLALVDV